MRNATDERSRQLVVRARPALFQALDAEVARQRAARPGQRISRADVARELILRALPPANAPGGA